MTVDEQILDRGQDIIPWDDFQNLKERIIQKYYFSRPAFWMWKAFQFGYVYGKRTERARKRKTAHLTH